MIWKVTRHLPYVSSPLCYQGRVYAIKNGGLASCYDAHTGATIYQAERMDAPGDYYSSAVGADDRVYVASQKGIVSVIDAASDATQLRVLARNDVGEQVFATPAILDGRIYLRTEKHLFAFGEKDGRGRVTSAIASRLDRHLAGNRLPPARRFQLMGRWQTADASTVRIQRARRVDHQSCWPTTKPSRAVYSAMRLSAAWDSRSSKPPDGEATPSKSRPSDGPDLMVLDFEMPRLTGAEVCRLLRTSERTDLQGLPVIMLTAHVGEADEISCLQAGANDFVTKPVSRDVLAARIHLTYTWCACVYMADELLDERNAGTRPLARSEHEADHPRRLRHAQQVFIPQAPPAKSQGWSGQTMYQPVIEVGGDVFGWRPAGDRRWLLPGFASTTRDTAPRPRSSPPWPRTSFARPVTLTRIPRPCSMP